MSFKQMALEWVEKQSTPFLHKDSLSFHLLALLKILAFKAIRF